MQTPATEYRKPQQTAQNSRGFGGFQLDFLNEIDDNQDIEEAAVLVTPPLPNHNGGRSSAMTTEEHTTRRSYPQHWAAYNAAQTTEKDNFHLILRDLCDGVVQPPQHMGRPRLPLADMVFAGALKVYTGFSARRFDSDVREAHRRDRISAAPSFISVNRYIADPTLMPIITELIERSASVLADIETDFAVDSSGFSTCRFDRWYDHKWGRARSKRQWLKAHISVGVRTNIITAVQVTGKNVNDSPVMPGLLDRTAVHFTMEEVSGDKAYLSDRNLRHIEGHGAKPYIPFKVNTSGDGSPMWRRLYAYFVLHEDEWESRYHKRSNVETAFSMVKGKFGDSVRSRTETGQVNEILLKCLCHNICVLVMAMHRFGLTAPTFSQN